MCGSAPAARTRRMRSAISGRSRSAGASSVIVTGHRLVLGIGPLRASKLGEHRRRGEPEGWMDEHDGGAPAVRGSLWRRGHPLADAAHHPAADSSAAKKGTSAPRRASALRLRGGPPCRRRRSIDGRGATLPRRPTSRRPAPPLPAHACRGPNSSPAARRRAPAPGPATQGCRPATPGRRPAPPR